MFKCLQALCPHTYRLLLPTFEAIGYEYTVEMTYPLPEAMSASVLNGFSQVCTILN